MPSRILSGEITRSESLSRVSMDAAFTFLCLISVADDFGRFDGRPVILLSTLFPTRINTVSMEVMNRWMHELEAEGLIRWYEVGGRRYVEIPSWDKYQRRRAAHSKYPAPLKNQKPASNPPTNASKPPQSASEVSRNEERGIEERKESAAAPPPAPLDPPPPKRVRAPRKPPSAEALASAQMLSDLLIEHGTPVVRTNGYLANWAREIDTLVTKSSDLQASQTPWLLLEAGIRWVLGAENTSKGRYAVDVRCGETLRKKWPQIASAAKRTRAETSGKEGMAEWAKTGKVQGRAETPMERWARTGRTA